MKLRNRLILVGFFISIIVSVEIFLRLVYGFCDAVLIQEDADFEYISQPNQSRYRFKNRIVYNSQSMRSEEVDSSAIIILGFGDSVINGGSLTDQDSIATTVLSDTLSKIYAKKVQFLNVSAGSWGPDNCYAYLAKHGHFGAAHLYLFVSSHDAYDNMNFEEIVSVNKSFPSEQYSSAIYELVDRYLIPRLNVGTHKKVTKIDHLGINKRQDKNRFNTGFLSFYTYSQNHGIPLTIYLHPDREETRVGQYNSQGQEIIQFAEDYEIELIKGLENGVVLSHFRDKIHINVNGQKKLAKIVVNEMSDSLIHKIQYHPLAPL